MLVELLLLLHTPTHAAARDDEFVCTIEWLVLSCNGSGDEQ